MRLLLATQNQGKVRELQDPLRALDIDVVGLHDLNVGQAEETGATFLENATIKARSAAEETGLWALAEDSGLQVDALHGAPGVRSARFAGEDAGDRENNAKLLAELAEIEEPRRTGRFCCVMVLAAPDGRLWSTEGTCPGRILTEPRGEGGFGYDPLFVPDGEERTFAELSSREKGALSHRGMALRKMLTTLGNVLTG